jgi:hypothetical protein
MNFIMKSWSLLEALFLRAEGFSCSLDILFQGLGISKMQFLIKFYFFQPYPILFEYLVV